jgi:hypothetical protein
LIDDIRTLHMEGLLMPTIPIPDVFDIPRFPHIPLTPRFLVAGANALIGLSAATNTGFIHHAGYWTHFDNRTRRSSWPLPRTADVNGLARAARELGVLSTDRPEEGELFLEWAGPKRGFAATGIVDSCEPVGHPQSKEFFYRCTTMEGDGRVAHRSTRELSPRNGDRFVRWVDLDRRQPERAALAKDMCLDMMLAAVRRMAA